ncbi:MAG TPA: hypothetical protein VMV29_03190 [Ktedonobacterales bacterium]|nr:hypothetical protein [Ktedonobacterales bacterium]
MRSQRPIASKRPRRLTTWAQGLLALYPREWRDRYGDEVGAVLDDFPVTPWTLIDVALGALDVRLRSDLLPRRLLSMAHRIRTSEIAIFAAFVLYCLAWLPLHFVADTPSVWQPTAQAHPELALALGALNFAGFLATLAILVGGIPLLIAAFWRALTERHWGVALRLALPLLAALAVTASAGFLTFSLTVRQAGRVVTPLASLTSALRITLGLTTIVILGVCAATVISAIQRSDLSLPVARFALIPAGLATVAMVVGTLGGLSLLTLVSVEGPQLSAPLPLEAIVALLLLAAAALAIVALWRGVRAARGGSATGEQAVGG